MFGLAITMLKRFVNNYFFNKLGLSQYSFLSVVALVRLFLFYLKWILLLVLMQKFTAMFKGRDKLDMPFHHHHQWTHLIHQNGTPLTCFSIEK